VVEKNTDLDSRLAEMVKSFKTIATQL